MEISKVKELAQVMAEHGLTGLELTEGDSHLCLKREPAPVAAPVPAPLAVMAAPAAQPPQEDDFSGYKEVKSPMVGVAYLAPEPQAPAFVAVGDRVKKGQTICIIEAMKLMNEIPAPADGEVVDICIENGQLVEFGQCLVKLMEGGR